MSDYTSAETDVVVNGTKLTTAQAMTVRVAIEALAVDLKDEHFLGDDAHALAMRAGYLRAIQEIRKVMLR